MPARSRGEGSEGGRSPPPRKSNATRTATKRSRCDGGNTCERAARRFERRRCRRDRWGEGRKGGAGPLRGNRMPRAPPQRGHAVSVTTAADGVTEVGTPLADADVQLLKAGDRVRISGVIYTARDAAHGRLLPLIDKGERLPIDVKGQIIDYTGPSPARPASVLGSVGPTTASR